MLPRFQTTAPERGRVGYIPIRKAVTTVYLSLLRYCVFLVVLASLITATGVAHAADAAQVNAPLKLRIVGGLASLHQFERHEAPFWNRELARLSQGKYSAEIVAFDSAGVPGGDMLRLVELGVVPFCTMLMSALLTAHPHYAASDLAGLNVDFASLKKSVAASRAYLESRLRAEHNVQLLAIYTYPAQVVFCKQAFSGLTDLQGRQVRVSSPSQADFFQALGARPVMTPFRQIVAHIRSGDVDCAVTGTMSGYTLGLHQVTTHIHTLPITWGLAIFAANKKAWDSLPPDLRSLISRELPALESAVWQESGRETAEGLACNTGVGACPAGPAGHMTVVAAQPADDVLRRRALEQTVLPRWLARCAPENCATLWQQTVGPALNIGLTP